ncbi:nitroreductase family protein [Metabacillus arenae]|uniref:Nitroreductase family protein n=1 Tax=Metabacillus arenae TaxID=2771434 RepID=A0A926NHI5_9BACI|nr:nitroreductase family protein [Metabacillus arenae]MBD1380683.1 nitroreductase family protein [Metabacillus arenae]
MEFEAVISSRRSVKTYKKDVVISKEELEEIIYLASLSPSAWNLQQWHFLIVTDDEEKERLKKAAWGQPKVKDASATIVVLGDLLAYERAEEVANDWISKNMLPENAKEQLISNVHSFYEDDRTKRDEAVRGASLAAMSIMYAAENKGYSTCPMIGFDPEEVCSSFQIPDHLVPVMMMTIGVGEDAPKERGYRRRPAEIITYNTF